MNYELKVTETNNKAARFHYQVVDESGNIISERKSNNTYVAATIDGQYYFGRIDLIGKGDHGNKIKLNNGYRTKFKPNGKREWIMSNEPKQEQTPIAYKK